MHVVLSHAASQIKGVEHGLGIGEVLSHNVIGGAVCGRGNRNRQAAMHRDTFFKAHQLHGNLALVVVHGDHAVVAAFFANGAHKSCVSGEGAVGWNARFVGHLYARCNDFDFFVAIVAVVAVVRVKATHRQAWG